MTNHLLRFLGLAAALGLVVGCGSKGKSGNENVATVTGKVTIAGKGPLPGGQITFWGGKESATGSIKSDGNYEDQNVPQGECKVSIDNTALKTAGATGAATEGMPGSDNGKYVPIDPKYSKPETSGLSTTVSGKTATYNPDLK
jgi:hypothetical protein